MSIFLTIFLLQKAKQDKTFLGTEKIRHIKNGTLYHHSMRVQSLLEGYGCDEVVQMAGMSHSLYSTEYFTEGIFDINNRDLLIKKIGKKAESLAFYFSKLDRKSLVYNEEEKTFSFNSWGDHEKFTLSFEDGVTLLHIMLANDIDHIEVVRVGHMISTFEKYRVFRHFLLQPAQEELDKIISKEEESYKNNQNGGAYIRFIAHAGVQIANKDISVLVDPWLYDSLVEGPLIEGFDPTQRTIDYLLPEPKNNIYELSPDIICLSHFHTHHSPRREILEFAKEKPITIVCPIISKEKLQIIKEKIGDYLFERITFHFVEEDSSISISGVTIRAFIQKQDVLHVMYYVQVDEKSLVHIVDAKANVGNHMSLGFSEDWERLYGLKPTVLFIGAAGHSIKEIHNGVRVIHEASSLTPVQAAKITSKILPKYTGVIGIYNHSVWDDRFEITGSVGDIESHFYWAVSFLAPSIKVKKFLPGDIIH